jgi:hypothetical protein
MAKKIKNEIAEGNTENLSFAAFIWNDPETKQKTFSSYCHTSEIELNELEKENFICEISLHETESEAKEQQFELSRIFNIDYQFN